MSNHRDLEVWQRSMQLAVNVYQITRQMPNEERFGLTAQIRSSATSVPSNIAEGCGRGHAKEFGRFLGIANGSLQELETRLEIAVRVGALPSIPETMTDIEIVGRMLTRLRQAIEKQG